jgi:EmrB/QacA subfamily drug resistance transporter
MTAMRRRHVFFGLAAVAVLMGSIDLTIVAVALPQLTDALHAPLTWVSWTLTAYQIVQVIMLPLTGKLSDTLGRKRVFLFCVGTFTLGSLLCGLAPSIGALIAARVIQAIGGGGLMPSAIGIISDQYQKHRARAIGLFSSVFPIGGIIGPNLGGYILEHWTWRELFFINVPIGVGVLVGVWLLLKEPRVTGLRVSLDPIGLALYAGALALLMYAITALADAPELWRNPGLWALLVTSLGLLVAFVRHIRHTPQPVIDYRLLAENPFLAANLYNFFFGSVVFGVISFVPYYMVLRYGMTAFQSGAVLTLRGIAMIIASTLASLFIIQRGYRAPMLAGMFLTAASLVLLGQRWNTLEIGRMVVDRFWMLSSILALGGVGMGLANPASNNAAIDLAPHQAAEVSGIRGMFRLTGGACSISATVLALSFFADKAAGLEVVFRALAGVLIVAVLPLTLMIPDTARERWRRLRWRLGDGKEPFADQPHGDGREDQAGHFGSSPQAVATEQPGQLAGAAEQPPRDQQVQQKGQPG